MSETTQFWLAVGTRENWHTAFDYGPIWGLRLSQRRFWELLRENLDLVFFYVTTPISGVVGYGIVRTKLTQKSPLWPEERAKNEVIWPLRFEFEALSALPPGSWETQRFSTEELKTRARSGFQELSPTVAQELLKALPSSIPSGIVLSQPIGPRAPQRLPLIAPASVPEDTHGRLQYLLADIGRMQQFVANMEYPLENRRLDVVWRKVERSVPSYVFEVQIGGNLTEAMGKLKQAFDLWNSNVFLVGKDEQREAVSQLSAGTFREIRHRLRFLELSQVEELHERKRSYRELEKNLGIFG